MNGAQALIKTLVDHGVTVSFTNPGTSEMHFVAALDDVPEMRGILCLFEGVATGAADGYGRMADRPAATLLHLGPGLGNGFANLHNARRGATPVLNIVGDHAIHHKPLDAPLESDIDSVASACSKWVRRSTLPNHVSRDALDAISASMTDPGGVATLILPADVCWSEVSEELSADHATPVRSIPAELVATVARELTRSNSVLVVGGNVMRERGLIAAHRVAAATGAKLLAETFPARLERGVGIPDIERLAYLAEFAEMQIGDAHQVVTIDTPAPVSFFAYPGKASRLTPPGCDVHEVSRAIDAVALLEAVADHLGASTEVPVAASSRPAIPEGELTSQTVADVVGALLPEAAIVVDEANTSGLFLPGATAGCPRHDWLCLTGGAIGIGVPLATGAAVACPDRPVLCMQADGSALYTLQGLWTQAREGLNVVTVILANRSYAVLNMELNRVGADNSGEKAQAMLDLTNPIMDFVALGTGLGVPSTRASTIAEFESQLRDAFATPGPHLIEAIIPPLGL